MIVRVLWLLWVSRVSIFRHFHTSVRQSLLSRNRNSNRKSSVICEQNGYVWTFSRECQSNRWCWKMKLHSRNRNINTLHGYEKSFYLNIYQKCKHWSNFCTIFLWRTVFRKPNAHQNLQQLFIHTINSIDTYSMFILEFLCHVDLTSVMWVHNKCRLIPDRTCLDVGFLSTASWYCFGMPNRWNWYKWTNIDMPFWKVVHQTPEKSTNVHANTIQQYYLANVTKSSSLQCDPQC